MSHRVRARSPARTKRSLRASNEQNLLATPDFVQRPEPAPLFDSNDKIASFFFKPHTGTILLVLVGFLAYVAMGEGSTNTVSNSIRGAVAAGFVYLLYSALQARDGLLVRPHRVVWRVVKGVAVLYLLFLVYLLFQTADDARKLMALIDPSLGVPLEEKMYAVDCSLYTPGDSRGNFANFMEAFIDEFFLAHLLGWFGKALILRDLWLTLTYSCLFELWEITFAHQLPNFKECWWDQIILDIILANGLGIYFGLKVCRYLEMRAYDWVGISHFRTVRGKAVRVAQQLMPASYEHYEWRIFSGWRPLLGFIMALALMSVVELNAFYLKTALWLPPSHPITVGRLVVWWAVAIPGMREYYQFLSDPREDRLGTMSWLSVAAAGVELLISYKFGTGIWREAVMPTSIKAAWAIAVLLFIAFFTWYFHFRKRKVE